MSCRISRVLLKIGLTLALLPGCQIFSPRSTDCPNPPKSTPSSPAELVKNTSPEAKKDIATTATTPLDPKKSEEPPVAEKPAPETQPRVSMKQPEKLQPIQHTAQQPPELEQARKMKHPLVDALQCMLEDRHQEALQHLQSYDQDTQEFFLRVLPTLTIFAKKRWDAITPAEVRVVDDQLRNLLTSLRSRSELTIDKMCYCEWIKAYGIFRPLRENQAFLASVPGRPGDLVQLYVELRNFASEPREGFFETRLSSAVEIRDSKGNLRRTISFDDNKQPLKSLTQLHDYFNNYSFYVPPDLEPGIYQLTVQVIDETIADSQRVARKSIDFRVGATAGQR